jgi:hypothetical protein
MAQRSILDQDLGLVLKPETIPAQFWIVDHVEMPNVLMLRRSAHSCHFFSILREKGRYPCTG